MSHPYLFIDIVCALTRAPDLQMGIRLLGSSFVLNTPPPSPRLPLLLRVKYILWSVGTVFALWFLSLYQFDPREVVDQMDLVRAQAKGQEVDEAAAKDKIEAQLERDLVRIHSVFIFGGVKYLFLCTMPACLPARGVASCLS